MRFRTEYIVFLVPLIVAVAAPFGIQYEDGDFMNQTGGAVPINDLNPENLKKHEDDYVIIYDHCAHETNYWFQEKNDEYEYYPIKVCEETDSEKIYLISELTGDADDNWEDIESGKLDFWSGRLVSGFAADKSIISMMRRSEVDFDEDEVWTLKVGVTPNSVYKRNRNILIAVWIVCFSGIIALSLMFRNILRKERLYVGRVKLVNVLNDQMNGKYHLIVDVLKGHVSKQDDIVITKKIGLKILRTEEYWDNTKDKNFTKLIIDKSGANLNWKAMINRQYGIVPSDLSLE